MFQKKILILLLFFATPFFSFSMVLRPFGNCASSFNSGFSKGPAFDLFQQAMKARDQAYAPYSAFYVGAALLTKDSNVYCGCNVENAAYGSTQCAEANAVGNMIVGGEKEIKAIALVLKSNFEYDKEILSAPCGNCRQILSEFANAETLIHIYTPSQGFRKTYAMKDLLPEAFALKHK